MRSGIILLALFVSAWAAEAPRWKILMTEAAGFNRAGRYSEAVTTYEAVLRMLEADPSKAQTLPIVLNPLGEMYDEMGRYPDAERTYKRALKIIKASFGESSVPYALVSNNLAVSYVNQRQFAAAGKLLRDVAAVYDRLLPKDDSRVVNVLTSLAGIATAEKRFEESAGFLLRATTIAKGPLRATVLSDLACVRLQQGRFQESESLMEEALPLLESALGPGHPALIRSLNNLAVTHSHNGRRAEAEAEFDRALKIAASSLGENHPDYGRTLLNYADHLRRNNEKAQAKRFESQARAILHESASRNGAGMVIDVSAFRSPE